MARSLFVTVVLLAGCTRPNPAFDLPLGSDSDDVAGTDTTDTRGETSGETGETSGETGEPDLPVEPEECPFVPKDGLDLKYGEIANFGGEECPPMADVWTHVGAAGNGMAMLATCSPGCEACGEAKPISIFPLLIEDYLPTDLSTCLRLEARTSLGAAPDICQWGAISIYNAFDNTPYLIATTHSSEPTPFGLTKLAGLIPAPVDVGSCDCDEVGQNHDCCYMAEPPQFWGYPWSEDQLLMPGGPPGALALDNFQGLQHYFEVIQAQRIQATCDDTELALSWAVYADLF